MPKPRAATRSSEPTVARSRGRAWAAVIIRAAAAADAAGVPDPPRLMRDAMEADEATCVRAAIAGHHDLLSMAKAAGWDPMAMAGRHRPGPASYVPRSLRVLAAMAASMDSADALATTWPGVASDHWTLRRICSSDPRAIRIWSAVPIIHAALIRTDTDPSTPTVDRPLAMSAGSVAASMALLDAGMRTVVWPTGHDASRTHHAVLESMEALLADGRTVFRIEGWPIATDRMGRHLRAVIAAEGTMSALTDHRNDGPCWSDVPDGGHAATSAALADAASGLGAGFRRRLLDAIAAKMATLAPSPSGSLASLAAYAASTATLSDDGD